jgi:hypothetical protein
VTDCLGVTCVLVSSLLLSAQPHPVSVVSWVTRAESVAAEAGAAEPANTPVARIAAAAMLAKRLNLLMG